jgi:hypothetical protein
LNGSGTLATSGNNTYTGGTTTTSGSLPAGIPHANWQKADDLPARGGHGSGGQASNGQPGIKLPPAPPPPPGPAPAAATPPAPTVLVSLDLELHPSGVEYLFTTPRGEAAITARALSDSLAGRLVRLAGLTVALLVLWILFATMRRWRAPRPA